MKKLIAIMITIVIAAICMAMAVGYFLLIYNADIPTWLKWVLLS